MSDQPAPTWALPNLRFASGDDGVLRLHIIQPGRITFTPITDPVRFIRDAAAAAGLTVDISEGAPVERSVSA